MNKYYKFLIITISIIGMFSCSTNKNVIIDNNTEKVALKWKVSDTIKYITKMEQIGEAEFNMDFAKTFGKVLNIVSKNLKDSTDIKNDSIKNGFDNLFEGDIFKEMKSEIKKINDNTELTTYLTKSLNFEKVVDIEMKRKSLKENDSVDKKNMYSMLKSGTQFKGSIYENGSLHSFWLNNAQRNIMSLFFELPTKQIKKGDIWSLKYLNYIQYGNIFYCDKAEKKNEVKLVDLIKENGETVALIEYDIYEFADGNIDFFGNKTPSNMKMKYNAKGKFSINKGKWISYKGFLSIETNGMMSSKSKQKFELIEKQPAGNTKYT